jgi:hypothetical protein
MEQLWEYRARTRRSEAQIRDPECTDEDHLYCNCMAGKNVADDDAAIMLWRQPAKILKPDGKPLCIWLPGAMSKYTQDDATYELLDEMGRYQKTGNRGLAGGTPSLPRGTQKRSYAVPVYSNIIGFMDPGGIYKTCRQTVYTSTHLERWPGIFPALQEVAGYLKEYVPARYEVQMQAIANTHPEWTIPGTPFSTITVNSTYPTGCHVDKGDLAEGYSTLFCARRGNFSGGRLCFPAYGVTVEMRDGDLLLMDAHSWHANTVIICECGHNLRAPCNTCGASRISVVAYYRTALQSCGTADEETAKAQERAERRTKS